MDRNYNKNWDVEVTLHSAQRLLNQNVKSKNVFFMTFTSYTYCDVLSCTYYDKWLSA